MNASLALRAAELHDDLLAAFTRQVAHHECHTLEGLTYLDQRTRITLSRKYLNCL